jgi:hypothetical protein
MVGNCHSVEADTIHSVPQLGSRKAKVPLRQRGLDRQIPVKTLLSVLLRSKSAVLYDYLSFAS